MSLTSSDSVDAYFARFIAGVTTKLASSSSSSSSSSPSSSSIHTKNKIEGEVSYGAPIASETDNFAADTTTSAAISTGYPSLALATGTGSALYGRLDRVPLKEDFVTVSDDGNSATVDRAAVRHSIKDRFFNDRPHKIVSFEKPIAFVMHDKVLEDLCSSGSLTELLQCISLPPSTITRRLNETKKNSLDHVLIVCSDSSLNGRQGCLDGMISLLSETASFKEVADRITKVSSFFHENLIGCDKFQIRYDMFKDHWEAWDKFQSCMWLNSCKNYPHCGCKHMSPEDFIDEFDAIYDPNDKEKLVGAVFVTRKMMYVILGCNEFYGFDGIIYKNDGTPLGGEFLVENRRICDPSIKFLLIGEIGRIRNNE